MNQKVIKIDLSTIFDDERKICCVLMHPNWKSVDCLQKRVQLLFDLDCVRFLSDGCFLPPQESIEIIKLCKDIKAFVPKDSLKLRKKKKKSNKNKKIEKSSEDSVNDKITLDEFDQEQVSNDSQKRKYNSSENSQSSCSFSNKAKRSKKPNNSISDSFEFLEKKHRRKTSKTKRSKLSLNSGCEESIIEKQSTTLKSEISDKNKHQTSTPKEMTKLERAENNADKACNDKLETIAGHRSSIPSSIFLNESKIPEHSDNSPYPSLKNPFKRPRSHLYFNATGEITSPTIKTESKSTQREVKQPKTTVIFHCPLSDVTKPQKQRIFYFKSINTSMANKTAEKEIVNIEEHIVLPRISIQHLTNTLYSPIEVAASEIVKQKEANETNKETDNADCESHKSGLDTTAIDKNDEKERDCTNSLEYTNVIETHNKSQTKQQNGDETVDCVDLSNELDEDDNKRRESSSKTTEIQQEQHDLTANGEISKSVSDIEEISEIIDLNETEDNSNTTVVNNSIEHNISLRDMRVDKILPFSSDLTDLPNIEDIIVFKVPYKNKSNKFVNTNFIAGKVEYINKRTKSIKILIIDGVSELCYIPNQFTCKMDDSQDFVKYLQLKLNEMREPKLFLNC